MTSKKAVSILGTATGWQGAIAKSLQTNPRTIRRLVASGDDISDWIIEKLDLLANNVKHWPRSE